MEEADNQEYHFRIDPQIMRILKKGPVDVDQTIELLYVAALNPAIQLYRIPWISIAKVRAKVVYELSHARQLWMSVASKYQSAEDCIRAMQQHEHKLRAVQALLDNMEKQAKACNCSGCSLDRGPDEYLPRFSVN